MARDEKAKSDENGGNISIFGVVKMAFFETLVMKRTIRVLIIILLSQQLKIRS
jgi:hypothetical protein